MVSRSMQPPWRREKEIDTFAGFTPTLPMRSPCRDARPGQTVAHPVGNDHATVDWSACPHRTPSGGGPLRRPRTEARYPARTTHRTRKDTPEFEMTIAKTT